MRGNIGRKVIFRNLPRDRAGRSVERKFGRIIGADELICDSVGAAVRIGRRNRTLVERVRRRCYFRKLRKNGRGIRIVRIRYGQLERRLGRPAVFDGRADFRENRRRFERNRKRFRLNRIVGEVIGRNSPRNRAGIRADRHAARNGSGKLVKDADFEIFLFRVGSGRNLAVVLRNGGAGGRARFGFRVNGQSESIAGRNGLGSDRVPDGRDGRFRLIFRVVNRNVERLVRRFEIGRGPVFSNLVRRRRNGEFAFLRLHADVGYVIAVDRPNDRAGRRAYRHALGPGDGVANARGRIRRNSRGKRRQKGFAGNDGQLFRQVVEDGLGTDVDRKRLLSDIFEAVFRLNFKLERSVIF